MLASGTLHHGAGLFGLLYASFGVGALTGSLVAAAAGPPTWGAGRDGIVGFGAALVAIAPLGLDPSRARGSTSRRASARRSGRRRANRSSSSSAPDRLRGRVLSLYWFVFAGLTPLGSIMIGVLAAAGGSALVFAAAGLVALATAGYVIWRIRAAATTFPSSSYSVSAWGVDSSASAARPAAR